MDRRAPFHSWVSLQSHSHDLSLVIYLLTGDCLDECHKNADILSLLLFAAGSEKKKRIFTYRSCPAPQYPSSPKDDSRLITEVSSLCRNEFHTCFDTEVSTGKTAPIQILFEPSVSVRGGGGGGCDCVLELKLPDLFWWFPYVYCDHRRTVCGVHGKGGRNHPALWSPVFVQALHPHHPPAVRHLPAVSTCDQSSSGGRVRLGDSSKTPAGHWEIKSNLWVALPECAQWTELTQQKLSFEKTFVNTLFLNMWIFYWDISVKILIMYRKILQNYTFVWLFDFCTESNLLWNNTHSAIIMSSTVWCCKY